MKAATDLGMATVLISEAILRLGIDPPISHDDLKRSLLEVLAEAGTTIRLLPAETPPTFVLEYRKGRGERHNVAGAAPSASPQADPSADDAAAMVPAIGEADR